MPIPIDISASRGAKILNVSKWGTRDEVWLEIMESREPGFCAKNNYELPVFEGNASTRWGLAFEDAIMKLAEFRESYLDIIHREVLQTHKKNKFITCHIDGKYAHTNTLHEGKTTNVFSYNSEWGEPGTDRIPLDYQIQCQHQLLCTGYKENIVSVLVFPKRPDEWEEMDIIPGNEFQSDLDEWARVLNQMGFFHQYIIKENKSLQKMMIAEYVDFWKKYVFKKTPPPAKTVTDIKSLVKSPVGTIICNGKFERMHNEYKLTNEEIKRVDNRKEQIKLEYLKYGTASQEGKNNPIDDDSVEKWIFMNEFGEKLFSYNGKQFRIAGNE